MTTQMIICFAISAVVIAGYIWNKLSVGTVGCIGIVHWPERYSGQYRQRKPRDDHQYVCHLGRFQAYEGHPSGGKHRQKNL